MALNSEIAPRTSLDNPGNREVELRTEQSIRGIKLKRGGVAKILPLDGIAGEVMRMTIGYAKTATKT
ncbi:MAG: hypothetical protein ACHQ0Y_02230 [Thermodesulfovibrionales bacterium]